MPPLPNVANVLKAQFQWTYGSDANVMTHIFFNYTTAAPSTSQLATYAAALRAAAVTNFVPLSHSSVALRTVTCIDLSTNATAPGTASGTSTGTRTGSALFASTAVLINMTIARRYRGGHPRIYLPFGVTSDIQDAQHWTTAFQNLVQTNFNAFVGSVLNVGSTPPVCNYVANLSYYQGGQLRGGPLVDPVSAYPVNPVPGTQRRRVRP